MTVLVNDVKSDIQMFQKFSDEHVKNTIKEATMQAKADSIDDYAFDVGVIEFSKHLLYADNFMNYGGVTSSSLMGTSQTIADKTDDDPYLNQYKNTVLNYGGGDGSFMLL